MEPDMAALINRHGLVAADPWQRIADAAELAVAPGRPRFVSRRGASRAAGGRPGSKTMRRQNDARTQSTFKEETS